MKIWRLIMVLGILALTAGCTTVRVYDEGTGRRIPDYETVMHTPDQDLTATLDLVQLVKRSEYSYEPKYFNLFADPPEIRKEKTAGLQMWIRIQNPKRVRYSMRYIICVKKHEQMEKIVKEIYSGSDFDYSWAVDCPTDEGEFWTSIEVYRGSRILFHPGSFHYRIIK